MLIKDSPFPRRLSRVYFGMSNHIHLIRDSATPPMIDMKTIVGENILVDAERGPAPCVTARNVVATGRNRGYLALDVSQVEIKDVVETTGNGRQFRKEYWPFEHRMEELLRDGWRIAGEGEADAFLRSL